MKAKNNSERGAELIEFAVVSFMLFFVFFAVVEFGRMALVYTGLADASRIAVRYAITHGVDRGLTCSSGGGCGTTDGSATAAQICGAAGVVSNYAMLTNSATLAANCTVTNPGGTVGSTVQVKVTYPYDPWFGLLPLGKVPLASTSAGVITY